MDIQLFTHFSIKNAINQYLKYVRKNIIDFYHILSLGLMSVNERFAILQERKID